MMSRAKRLAAAGSVAGALALACAAAPAQAAPATGAATAAMKPVAGRGPVTEVQWGGRGRHRFHGRHGWGPGPWLGLGAGVVIGSIIANEAYRPRAGYYYDDEAYDGPYYYPSGYSGDPRAVCAQNFRSFEWRTGLYTTYSGEKRVCPYLR